MGKLADYKPSQLPPLDACLTVGNDCKVDLIAVSVSFFEQARRRPGGIVKSQQIRLVCHHEFNQWNLLF